ncbi:MAG: SWIM zinc finger family protein [Chloroflexi bacterium]|nr:SWIM zinc finger family protein [Chloroflexota bacterium]
MGAMKDAYMVAEEALSAFLAEHPGVDAEAIRERWERAYFLFQAGAVGPQCPETGTRHVRAEAALGRAKLIPGQFTSYRVDLAGRTCDCADYTYRLGRSDFPGWCKHLLAVWMYTSFAHQQAPAPELRRVFCSCGAFVCWTGFGGFWYTCWQCGQRRYCASGETTPAA